MNKNKFLWIICIGLLISNFLLIGFMLMKNPVHGLTNPKDVIIKNLHFDEAQKNEYSLLIKQHRSDIREQKKNIFQTRNALYKTLNQTYNKSQIDSLIQSIALYNQKVEAIHYSHFSDIRDICTGEQKEDFKKLSQRLSKLFSQKQKHPRR